jgi:hypothetical protein
MIVTVGESVSIQSINSIQSMYTSFVYKSAYSTGKKTDNYIDYDALKRAMARLDIPYLVEFLKLNSINDVHDGVGCLCQEDTYYLTPPHRSEWIWFYEYPIQPGGVLGNGLVSTVKNPQFCKVAYIFAGNRENGETEWGYAPIYILLPQLLTQHDNYDENLFLLRNEVGFPPGDTIPWTLLQYASACHLCDTVEFLLEMGAKRHFRDKMGNDAKAIATCSIDYSYNGTYQKTLFFLQTWIDKSLHSLLISARGVNVRFKFV